MKKNEKKLRLLGTAVIAAFLAFAFASCESTGQEPGGSASENAEHETKQKKDEQFLRLQKILENIDISLVSSAVPAELSKIPVAGTAFKKPYTVSVKDLNGNAYPAFPLTVTYPVSKNGNTVSFATAEIVTGENGEASFMPPVISTSMNSAVTFEPSVSNYTELLSLAKAAALEVPCKVRFSGRGVLISLVDYNENGKMILNSPHSTSSNLVGAFWKAGYTTYTQNADFHTSIEKGPDAVYNAARNLLQGANYFKYIIYGDVKYASGITAVEGGYSLSLKGTATVIDYATGKAYFTTTKTVTVTDKNKWNILKACQSKLANELADDLICSM